MNLHIVKVPYSTSYPNDDGSPETTYTYEFLMHVRLHSNEHLEKMVSVIRYESGSVHMEPKDIIDVMVKHYRFVHVPSVSLDIPKPFAFTWRDDSHDIDY